MEQITLCGKIITVYPLKIGRIKRKVILPLLQLAQGAGGDGFSSFEWVRADEETYKLLVLLAPKVGQYVPLHEFLGYATADAMVADDWHDGDPDEDLGVSIPELEQAFKTAITVSRLDIFGEVKRIVDPEWARAQFTLFLDEKVDEVRAQLKAQGPPSTSSESSPSTRDGSDPSTSGTTTPKTSTASSESPSLASSV